MQLAPIGFSMMADHIFLDRMVSQLHAGEENMHFADSFLYISSCYFFLEKQIAFTSLYLPCCYCVNHLNRAENIWSLKKCNYIFSCWREVLNILHNESRSKSGL
jgi:hypothetical protein